MKTVQLLGQKIKQAILDRGYESFELFAHHHDIHKGTLSKIINGRVDPKFSTLFKISKALELPDSFFFSLPKLGMAVQESAKTYKSISKRSKKNKIK